MGKQKKRRNKTYQGSDAKNTAPQIVRVAAVDRSAPKQWWFERKRVIKPIAIGVGVAAFVIILVVELIRLITS